MVFRADYLNCVLELGFADLLLVYEYRCLSVIYSFLHLVDYLQRFDINVFLKVRSVILLWKHSKIHTEFNALTMKDSTVPITSDVIVEAKTLLL